MDAGLIQVGQTSAGTQQGSSSEANLSPKQPGKGDLFMSHLQRNANGPVQAAPGDASNQLNPTADTIISASQPSASLQETLMGRLQSDAILNGLTEVEGIETAGLEKLKALGKKLGDLDALLEGNASLAFITGRLEFVVPQDVAEVVSSSPFIQAALASGDPASFMKEPQPLGKLIDDLQLPKATKQMVAQAGLDLNQVLTPAQLMGALGIDPGVVGSELQMLRDNMQIDGLSRYMLRAATLRKQQPALEKALGADIKPDDHATAMPAGEAKLAAVSAAGMQSERAVVKAQVDTSVASADKLASVDLKTPPSGFDVNQISKPNATNAISFEQVKADPTKDVARALEQMSTREAFQFDANHAAKPTNTVSPADRLLNSRELGGEIAVAAVAPQITTPKFISSDAGVMTLDRLMASQLLPQVGADGQSGFGESFGDSEQEFTSGAGIELSQLHEHQATSKHHTGADFIEVLKQTEQSSQQVQKEVVDKAQILLKEGGGQIKMDIGGGEQKVEVALDIRDNNVNLKILAGSEQMKDLLASDIPKLREALNQQNLSLNEVELGSHSQRQWSQGSFNQDGNFHREFAEQQQTYIEQPHARTKSSSRSYDSMSIANAHIPRARHQGQIRVFA